ncbi:carbonic anhydrase 4-like [Pelodytes ibericus]
MKSLSLVIFLTWMVIIPRVEGADWCYDIIANADCPGTRKWGEHYTTCSGKNQSPINVATSKLSINTSLKPFTFEGFDIEHEYEIENNGHSAEVKLSAHDMKITGGGLTGTYYTIQLHFHWGSETTDGSEHSINGERFPMELHIVNNNTASTKQDLAVLGFFYEETEQDNANYKNLIDALSNIVDKDKASVVDNIKIEDLIPDSTDLKHYYRYQGSLTTPPCSETVTWTLFPTTIKLSKAQLNTFYKLNFKENVKMEDNFRPVQRLNTREVETSKAGAILSQITVILISAFVSFLVIAS